MAKATTASASASAAALQRPSAGTDVAMLTQAVRCAFGAVPGRQVMQTGVPLFGATVLGGQGEQACAPSIENVPGGQIWQLTEPNMPAKEPALQGRHSTVAELGAKVPGLQCRHSGT